MGIRLRILTAGAIVLAPAGCRDGSSSDADPASGTASGTATDASDDTATADGTETGDVEDGWTDVGVGTQISCGLRGDRSIWCWGQNPESATVGSSLEAEILVPTRIESEPIPTSLVVGRHAMCVLDASGSAWCWGLNSASELGLGDDVPRTEPTRIEPDGWLSVALGSCGCGIREDRSLWCWGYYSDLGLLPSPVDEAPGWATVSHGQGIVAAIRDDGSLWQWWVGPLKGLIAPFGPARTWSKEPGALSVSSSGGTLCAIAVDRSLWCWGSDSNGQLGNGPSSPLPNAPDPVAVSGDREWQRVSGGRAHACAIDVEQRLWCWGSNEFGQLGNGSSGTVENPTAADVDVPMPVSGGHSWLQVASGQSHVCAIDVDHELWCWGQNHSGSLGLGDLEPRTEPTLVPAPML